MRARFRPTEAEHLGAGSAQPILTKFLAVEDVAVRCRADVLEPAVLLADCAVLLPVEVDPPDQAGIVIDQYLLGRRGQAECVEAMRAIVSPGDSE